MAGMDRFFTSDNDAGANQVESSGRSGINFNPQYPIKIVSPSYDGKVSIFRLLPCFDTETTPYTEVPFRLGLKYSPWFRSYPAVKSIGCGNNKPTIYLNNPQINKSWDKNSNPLVILRNEVQRAVQFAEKANGAFPDGRRLFHGGPVVPHYWSGLIKGSQGKGADLPYLTSLYICYVLVYQHSFGNKLFNDGPPIGVREGDTAIVGEFSQAFWQDCVMKEMGKAKANYQGNPDDFENSLENGDPVSTHFGRFLHVFKIGSDPRQAASQLDSLAVYQQTNNNNQQPQAGYSGFFTKTLPGYPHDNSNFPAKLNHPEPYAYLYEMIRNRYVPLDNIVQVMSPLDQARALYRQFNPEVLMYAWEKYPHFITDELRQIAHEHVSVTANTPGATPMHPPVSGHTTTPPAAAPFLQPGGFPGHAPAATPAAPWSQPQAPAAPVAPWAQPQVATAPPAGMPGLAPQAPAAAAPGGFVQQPPAGAPAPFVPPQPAAVAPPAPAAPAAPPGGFPAAPAGVPPMAGFNPAAAAAPAAFTSGATAPAAPAAAAPWPAVPTQPAAVAPPVVDAAFAGANPSADFPHAVPVNPAPLPTPAINPAGINSGLNNLAQLQQASAVQ